MGKINLDTLKKGIKDHAPEITIGLGVGGFLATNVLVGVATYKAVRKNDAEEAELGRKTTKKEKLKNSWKYYVAPASTAVLSTGAIFYGDKMNLKKNVAATTAYVAEKAAFGEYREVVKESLTDKQYEKVEGEYEKREKEVIEPMIYDVNVPVGEQVYCYDSMGFRFIASPAEIQEAVNLTNGEINRSPFGGASFREYLGYLPKLLTKPLPKWVNDVGWNIDRQVEVSMDKAILVDGIPHLLVAHIVEPIRGYDKQI